MKKVKKVLRSLGAFSAAAVLPMAFGAVGLGADALAAPATDTTVVMAQDDAPRSGSRLGQRSGGEEGERGQRQGERPGKKPGERAGKPDKGRKQNQPELQKGLQDLGACVSRNEQLDVMLLMDETGSLVPKDGEWKGTDPEHNRVPAAQTFVESLAERQEDTGTKVRVRVTGFGETYKSGTTDQAYGDWMNLDTSTVDSVKKEIEAFKDRANEDWTRHSVAVDGAYNDFTQFSKGQENPCRMLVMFTDGASTSPEGGEAERQALCRAGGPVDKLRAAGITLVTIGLRNPEDPTGDFDILRRASEGTPPPPCGDRPANGAFFEATNVGGLVIAFQQALRDGGDFEHEGTAGEPFKFVLDDSINAVRFSVTSEQDLGEKAKLVLTAPDGSTIDLVDKGDGTVGDAKVEWTSYNERFQASRGRMTLPDGGSWGGEWSLQFQDFNPDKTDGRVVSNVQIQPDLTLKFTGSEGEEEKGPVAFADDESLKVQLVDGKGNARKMKGKAVTTITLSQQGQKPVTIVENADLSKGELEIPASKFPEAPFVGRLDAATTITTSGDKGRPSTLFSPILSSTGVTVSKQNMPQLSNDLKFATESETAEATLKVKGPGKVWIEPGTSVKSDQLPEGVGEIKVESKHNSKDTALEVPAGETADLPVTFTIPEATQGLVNGAVDVSIADLDDEEEPVVIPVDTNGTFTVPLNKAAFTGALIGALLLSLIIPLLIFYLIRYLTSRIPTKATLRTRAFRLDTSGGYPAFVDGSPRLGEDNSNESVASLSPNSFSASGYSGKVKALNLNPFSEVPVVVEQVPSVSDKNAQVKNAAKLPLSLNGSWFVAANPQEPNAYDAVVLYSAATPQEKLDQLAIDIERNAPSLVEKIAQQRPAEQVNAAGDPNDPFSGTQAPSTSGPADPFAENNDPYGGFNQGGFGQGGFDQGGQGGFGQGGQGGFGQPNDPFGPGR
ncbi:vWA domain-containing protein [Corynebacterium aquatimens]|uniref:VWFA domain-containing protein n=1 Tax=Corynebacterium aquatimens TaxID=1190508 RepID=A0A931E4D0_9CORY|nr:vWA domain-containing protein [Corynebacterium aquatimens]MBG6122891.1 hypothetical protein [Corynebacterium aquatimens]